MASIRSQMVLNDGISGVLRKINTALNTTLNAFEQVQRASGNAVDTAQIQAARAALVEANREVDNMAEGYRRAAQQEEVLNRGLRNGASAADGMLGRVKSLVAALAAGALRGEELNSILENAPGIARAIESYMGVAEGSIKQYAEQGLITSEVVKNALFSVADETNAKFESMPMTWAQVWTTMQNKALSIFDPILARINQVANSERFSTVTDGIISGLAGIAAVAGVVLDLLISGGALVVDNWSWISPIVWGLVAAFLAYNTVALITNGINGAMALAEGVKAAALAMSTGATFAATAAQYGLNAALLACPITWIVVLVIALVAAFYAAVAAINHFAGTSLSATGLIMGAFAVAGAFLINLVLGVVNFVIGLGVELYNLIATFANFFANVFNDPVGAIINLFAGMFDFILGIVESAASLIDTVLGTDMSSAVAGFRNSVATKVEEIVGDQVEVMEKLDASDYQIQRIEYGDAWAAGNDLGKGIEDAVGGLFDFDLGTGEDYGAGFTMDDIANNAALTAENTGATADALTASNEELAYLRDIAEREAINRFTTAEVRIDMTGMTNRIEGSADLDGVISELTNGFTEALVTAAEGVHT